MDTHPILHLFNDEKVVDRTINNFETVYPSKSKYIVLVKDENKPCQIVKTNNGISVCQYGSPKFYEEIGNIYQYKHILIHSLDKDKINFINNIHHNNITWIVWGGDLYEGLLARKGYRLYIDDKLPIKAGVLSAKHRYFAPLIRWLNPFKIKPTLKAISSIANIAAIDEDLQLLLTYFPKFNHLKKLRFFYYPIDDVLQPELKNANCYSNNIMLGHSSNPNGNHLDSINIIKEAVKNEFDGKIYVPLSYGSTQYRDYLLGELSKINGLNIEPLLSFLPLKDYNSLLVSCSNFVYATLRQEAMGNILVALYLGGKVFLFPSNSLFSYFSRMGVKVFSIYDINRERLCTPLEASVRESNRRIILSLYNLERLKSAIKTSFPI